MSVNKVDFDHHVQFDFLNDGYKFDSGGLVNFNEGIGYYLKDMLSNTSYMIPKIHDGIIPMVHFKIPD